MPWPTSVSEYRGSEPLRAVVSGLGAVRERLAAHLLAQNVTRPMIVCGESVSRSPVLQIVQDALGDVWPPVVFDGSRPHTPAETVAAGAAAARAAGADAFIAVGGGSTMDCARGMAVLLATGLDEVSQLAPAEYGKLGQRAADTTSAGRPPMPVACVSTALSFAEFLPFWGSRHADVARKRPYLEDGHVTRTVFLDGEVAAHTPSTVWCETGVKALDDALMAYCRAPDSEPFADPMLTSAIAALGTLLPRSRAEGTIVERQHVLTAVWMTKFTLPRLSARVEGAGAGWFSTTARHSLGAVLEVPHGIGSCVALLPGIRYHRSDTGVRQMALKRAVSWGDNVTYASLDDAVAALLARLHVPMHLLEIGVDASRLDDVVAAMVDEAPWLGTPEQLRAACTEML
jgi:alcohol dehydrogenase class IV